MFERSQNRPRSVVPGQMSGSRKCGSAECCSRFDLLERRFLPGTDTYTIMRLYSQLVASVRRRP
jgi:hypothetical protein